jgi:hypothetical protein
MEELLGINYMKICGLVSSVLSKRTRERNGGRYMDKRHALSSTSSVPNFCFLDQIVTGMTCEIFMGFPY